MDYVNRIFQQLKSSFLFFFFGGYLSPCGHIHKIKWNVFRRFSILVNQNLKPKEPRPNNVHGPLAFSIHTQIFRDLPYLISVSIFFRDPDLFSTGIHIQFVHYPHLKTGAHRSNNAGIASHTLALNTNAVDVGAAGNVPHGNVLVHAAGQAGVLLSRHGGAGSRDTGLEAVLVHFLDIEQSG